MLIQALNNFMASALFLPIIILVLFILRQNLIVILGVSTAYAYWAFGDGVISNIVVDAWDAANKDILLSIPLFILAGNIMSRGGMASRLIDLMTSLTAPIPGGLAIATIMSCAAFAAVSGSGTVTLLADLNRGFIYCWHWSCYTTDILNAHLCGGSKLFTS